MVKCKIEEQTIRSLWRGKCRGGKFRQGGNVEVGNDVTPFERSFCLRVEFSSSSTFAQALLKPSLIFIICANIHYTFLYHFTFDFATSKNLQNRDIPAYLYLFYLCICSRLPVVAAKEFFPTNIVESFFSCSSKGHLATMRNLPNVEVSVSLTMLHSLQNMPNRSMV